MATVEIPDELVPEGYRVEYRAPLEGEDFFKSARRLVLVPITKWRDARLSDLLNGPVMARCRSVDNEVWTSPRKVIGFCWIGGLLHYRDEYGASWKQCQVQVPADERDPREWWIHPDAVCKTETSLATLHVREVLP